MSAVHIYHGLNRTTILCQDRAEAERWALWALLRKRRVWLQDNQKGDL